MLILPSSGTGSRRVLMFLDSLISMGALLAIGWYLLLGDLALHSKSNILSLSFLASTILPLMSHC